MRKYFIFTFFLLVKSIGFSQNSPVDFTFNSKVLSGSIDSDSDFSIQLNKLRQNPRPEEAAKILIHLSDLQRWRGDYADGLESARKGLKYAKDNSLTTYQCEFLYRIGRLFWNLGDYPHSLESHLEELRLAEKLDIKHLIAQSHFGLGITYYRFGQNQNAYQQLIQAYQYAIKDNNNDDLILILNGLGNYYLTEKNYKKSEEYYLQSLRLHKNGGFVSGTADSLTNLGLIALAQGEYDKALKNLNEALDIYTHLKYKRYIANTHRRIATVLRNMGRLNEAYLHLNTAINYASELKSPDVMLDIYAEYSATAEKHNDYKMALDFEKKYSDLKEQLRSDHNREVIAGLESQYKFDQQQMQIQILKSADQLKLVEIGQRRSQILALLAGLSVVIIITGSIILVQRYRLKAERQTLAVNKEARIKAESAEKLKTKLFEIASHDLKVPLRSLYATADLIADSKLDYSDIKRLAENMRVDTLHMRSLVEAFLTAVAIENGNLQVKSERIDLSDLSRIAVEGVRLIAQGKKQNLIFKSEVKLWINADQIRMRQVIDNLLSNALKFSPLGGSILITAGSVDSWAYVEISDSGPGFTPQDFAKLFQPHAVLSALPTAGEDSSGLGLFISNELVALQGGRLEVESQPNSGAVLRVLLPLAVIN